MVLWQLLNMISNHKNRFWSHIGFKNVTFPDGAFVTFLSPTWGLGILSKAEGLAWLLWLPGYLSI